MTNEEHDKLYEYKSEIMNVYDLANRLDALYPEIPGAFTGTPSERIKRHLRAMRVPGFESE